MYTDGMLLIAILLVTALQAQPQPSTPDSIANGKKLFSRNCAACHGTAGKGDGSGGAKLNPKPSDLTDAEWKHGSSPTEIFTVIHDGVRDTGMKGYASRLTEREIWDLVNYVRSLSESSPGQPPSR
jgi:high-affinity iron transporter